jgi:hypothetical protein
MQLVHDEILTKPKHAHNYFPHDFWSSFEYSIRYQVKLLVFIEWSHRPTPNHVDF